MDQTPIRTKIPRNSWGPQPFYARPTVSILQESKARELSAHPRLVKNGRLPAEIRSKNQLIPSKNMRRKDLETINVRRAFIKAQSRNAGALRARASKQVTEVSGPPVHQMTQRHLSFCTKTCVFDLFLNCKTKFFCFVFRRLQSPMECE